VGKRKVKSEGEFSVKVLPAATDVMGIAKKMLGFDRILVTCQDGKERLCRIRGSYGDTNEIKLDGCRVTDT
jgi:translation initiation factor 1A